MPHCNALRCTPQESKHWLRRRMHPVRRALDEAVLEAVPGLRGDDVDGLRRAIPLEPSVNNRREPLDLREAPVALQDEPTTRPIHGSRPRDQALDAVARVEERRRHLEGVPTDELIRTIHEGHER